MKFSIYCDGSSGGNSTGAIGWGWVIVTNGNKVLAAGSGGDKIGTNNVAELMAAREGLRALLVHPAFTCVPYDPLKTEIELVSDSQYVLGLADGSYAASKNVALAEHVREICVRYAVTTRWVRGHSGDPLNEICDRLAKLGKSRYIPAKVKRREERKRRRRKR